MSHRPSRLAPFRVLGVQQIAIGGDDKGALRAFWSGLLGIPQTGSYRSESHNVDEDILALGAGAHAVEIDLMEPVDADQSPRVNSPRAQPPRPVGRRPHLPPSSWLKQEAGVRVLGEISPGAAGHDVCFVHPKGNEASPIGATGVLLELVQAPPEVIAALGGAPPS